MNKPDDSAARVGPPGSSISSKISGSVREPPVLELLVEDEAMAALGAPALEEPGVPEGQCPVEEAERQEEQPHDEGLGASRTVSTSHHAPRLTENQK